MIGYCNRCGRVWTLEIGQGRCQWCGKTAICHTRRTTALRAIKSSSRRRQRQAEHNGNGYDRLDGDWLTYYKVASRFNHKAMAEDREDLLHDIMLTLALANKSSPMSMAAMYRTAEHVKDHYWYEHFAITKGLDCQHCSKAQRATCREGDLYSECPKAIKLESLNKPILDSEGNLTELGELIADDNAVDLDQWTDIRTFLLNAPLRLKQIASKIRNDQTLTGAERKYLAKLRKRNQKALF